MIRAQRARIYVVMKAHNIPIIWKERSIYDIHSIFSRGLAQSAADVGGPVEFQIVTKTGSIEKLGFDTGVVIAVVSSSVALATSVLSCIAQIASANMTKRNAVMEVGLADGSSIKVPLSATASDIERLLQTIKALNDVREIRLNHDEGGSTRALPKSRND